MDKSQFETQTRKGQLVAETLAGSRRLSPPPLSVSSEQLTEVAPLLLETGAGALGWWRIRDSHLRSTPAARRLHDAYRMHALQAAVHEGQVAQAVTALRSAGVTPLLAKGWAVARLYLEPGLRPYGDVDLAVPRHQEQQAQRALESCRPGAPVDLHPGGFSYLPDRTLDELHKRAQVATIGDVEVRTLGPEDHLRLLCLHLMKHSAWRPLWLCDVGLMVESLPSGFDWGYFLSGDRRHTAWAVCVLGLSHRLLGATLDAAPAEVAAEALEVPERLVSQVLAMWAQGHPEYETTMIGVLRSKTGVLKGIRQRWPDRINANMRWRWPNSKSPALPFQLASFTERAIQFAKNRSKERAL